MIYSDSKFEKREDVIMIRFILGLAVMIVFISAIFYSPQGEKIKEPYQDCSNHGGEYASKDLPLNIYIDPKVTAIERHSPLRFVSATDPTLVFQDVLTIDNTDFWKRMPPGCYLLYPIITNQPISIDWWMNPLR